MNTTRFILVALCLAACGAPAELELDDDTSKMELAAAIAGACPPAASNDRGARERCADALAELGALRDHLADPVLWGGQPANMALDHVLDDASLTEFSPFVWRRMYLSTFMVASADATVEAAGKYRVLRLPVQFRNNLDSGDYPYPFWHSEKKWRSYETTLDLLFFFDGEKIAGVVRSASQDQTRSHVERVWDGSWTWDEGAQPKNALYRSLFSSMNPYVERLESSYRTLEDGLRGQNCNSCHDPSNSAQIKHLELLNYPNQALSGRHDIVAQLEANAMPPGIGVGEQVTRFDLIRLAREFARAGDEALAFEGEPVPRRSR